MATGILRRNPSKILAILVVFSLINFLYMLCVIVQNRHTNVTSRNGIDSRHPQKTTHGDVPHRRGNRGDHHVIKSQQSNGNYQHTIARYANCGDIIGLRLLIVVVSSPHDSAQRASIRETWGSEINPNTTQFVFLVDHTDDNDVERSVKDEHSRHRDIVWTNVDNVASNSTYRLTFLIRWVKEYCTNTRYILKTDDTTLLFPRAIIAYLETIPRIDFAGGQTLLKSGPVRDPNSPWYISKDIWPESNYPPYLEHPSYLLSLDIFMRASMFLDEIKPFPFEDVYFGIILKELQVKPIHIKTFDIHGSNRIICDTETRLLSGRFSAEEMKLYWESSRLCNYNANQDNNQESRNDVNKNNNDEKAKTFHHEFISFPESKCFVKSNIPDKGDVFLFIVTPSTAEDTERRVVIRNTRGTQTFVAGKKIVQLFLVSKTFDEKTDKSAEEESRIYKDMIIVNLHDDTNIVARNTIIIMELANLLCPNAKYIMEANDNVFVNLNYIIRILLDQEISRFAMGYVNQDLFPDKNTNNLRTRSKVEWPENKPYPPFPVGATFIVSHDVANEIYTSAKNKPTFQLFDRLDIGIVLQDIGVSLVHHDGFLGHVRMNQTTLCELKYTPVAKTMTSQLTRFLWQQLENWGDFVICDHHNKASHKPTNTITIDNGKIIGMDTSEIKNGKDTFIINNDMKCSRNNNNKDPFMLVCIFSRPDQGSLRTAIRESWGAANLDINGYRVETLFLIGVDQLAANTEQNLAKESAAFGDIVVANFIESEQHTVLKTMVMLKWAITYCKQAKYLVKGNAEIFINYENLIAFLKQSPNVNFFMGAVKLDSRPERVQSSSWYTPETVWSWNAYPPYIEGQSYVMSMDVVERLFPLSFKVPLFKWADVYLGILSEKVGVNLYSHIHFDLTGQYHSECALQAAIASNYYSPEMHRKYWKILQSNITREHCKRFYLEKLQPRFGVLSDLTPPVLAYKSQQCISSAGDVKLIILVVSPPSHYENRRAARLTWAREDNTKSKGVRVYFVIGRPRTVSIQKAVANELELYQDILYVNAIESPANSTLIQMIALQWLNVHCSNGKYVAIAPTDIFINTDNIVHYLRHAPKSTYVTCYVIRNGVPIRKTNSPWYVSDEEWPYRQYPPHCSDKTAAIYSMDSIKHIVDSSIGKKLFKYPEIHFGAMLQNLKMSHNTAFNMRGVASYLQNEDMCGLQGILATAGFSGDILAYITKQTLQGSFAACQLENEQASSNLLHRNREELVQNIRHLIHTRFMNHTVVNSHDIPIITNHPERCMRHRKGVFLLILVVTNPDQGEYRKVIRSSWSKDKNVEGAIVEYVFLMGRPVDAKHQEAIWSEDNVYMDIIQEDFIDVFQNQTLKTIMGLKWATQYCSNAKFIIKAESHTYVHVPNLIQYLKSSFTQESDLVSGRILTNSRPVRSQGSTYYVPFELFPGEIYSPYPEGRGYLMSYDVAVKTYLASAYIKLFPWEDVYFGMLLEKVSISPRKHSDFISDKLTELPDVCYMRNAFTWNTLSPQFMSESYDKLQNSQNVSCFEADRVKPDLYQFTTSNAHVCTNRPGNVNLLISVMTAPRNFGRRRAIRETWGLYNENITGFQIATVFMVGITRDETVLELLEEEDAYYHDIVVSSFYDCYQNLTLKTVMMLKWVSTYCKNADYVMKVDDDVFVNIDQVLSSLREAPTTSYSLGLTFYSMWPVRDPKHKNYTPRDLWPDRFFPPYNSGPCYIMSSDVVLNAYKASFGTKRFLNEDVFMGILLESIGVSPQRDSRFDISGKEHNFCGTRNILATHKTSPHEAYKFWYWLKTKKDIVCTDNNLPDNQYHLYYYNRTRRMQSKSTFSTKKSNLCQNLVSTPNSQNKIVVAVASIIGNTAARLAIRNTWGAVLANDEITMKTIFFVGTTLNVTEQMLYDKESQHFLDIVQVNVPDASVNTTFKLIAMLEWLTEQCDQINHVIKTDDGTFLNTPKIGEFFTQETPSLTKYVGGSVISGSRPNRDNTSEYYTPEKVWPFPTFPVYVESPTFILSMDVVKNLNSISKSNPPMLWEDVFMGILLDKLGIKPKPITGLDFKAKRRTKCDYRSSLATAFFTPNQMKTFWHENKDIDLVCEDT